MGSRSGDHRPRRFRGRRHSGGAGCGAVASGVAVDRNRGKHDLSAELVAIKSESRRVLRPLPTYGSEAEEVPREQPRTLLRPAHRMASRQRRADESGGGGYQAHCVRAPGPRPAPIRLRHVGLFPSPRQAADGLPMPRLSKCETRRRPSAADRALPQPLFRRTSLRQLSWPRPASGIQAACGRSPPRRASRSP